MSAEENEYYLFMGNEVLNIFSTIFLKKATFLEKMGKSNFWGTRLFFMGRGHLTLKMNITFLIKNYMLNIFMIYNFFGKSRIL